MRPPSKSPSQQLRIALTHLRLFLANSHPSAAARGPTTRTSTIPLHESLVVAGGHIEWHAAKGSIRDRVQHSAAAARHHCALKLRRALQTTA